MSCCSSLLSVGLRCCVGAVRCWRGSPPPARWTARSGPAVTQGPGERFPAHRELVTLGRGVQVRPAAGCGGRRIGHDGRLAVRVRADGHPQQLALGGSLPASDAGPDRSRRGMLSERAEDYGSLATEVNTSPEARGSRTGRGARAYGRAMAWFEDRFAGPDLDRDGLVPPLPARLVLTRGRPRRAYRAGHRRAGPRHPRRPPGVVPRRPRPAPLRVSGIQSGSWSGPRRQQPAASSGSREGSAVPRGAGAVRGLAARAAAGSRSRPGWSSRRARWPRSG